MARPCARVIDEVDGQSVFFRDTGLHLRWVTPRWSPRRRRTPRALQVALTRRCNLRCPYCAGAACSTRASRELRRSHPGAAGGREDPQFWTHERVMDLARLADRWGVAELTFGGGEPLLFEGLAPLLVRVWEETSLGVGVTTNGSLLTAAFLEELGGRGQLRVSVHPGSDWRAPVALLRAAGQPFGVNLLVTPELLARLEETVEELARAGVRELLLLRYHGDCPSFELSPRAVRELDERLARLHDELGDRVSLSVDRCWGELLVRTPLLFGARDCGAGLDVLSLDADGRVAGCSFQPAAGELAELPSLYRRLSLERERAPQPGCARPPRALGELAPQPAPGCARQPRAEGRLAPGLYVWRAHASNNSAPAALVARFGRRELAGAVARELREWLELGEEVLVLDRPLDSLPAVSDESLAVAAEHEAAWEAPIDGNPDGPIELALDAETVMLFNDYCLGFHEGISGYLADRGGAVRRPATADPPWISVRLRLPEGQEAQANALHRFLHEAVEYQNLSHWQQGPRAPWQTEAAKAPRLRVGAHHRDGQVFLFNVGLDVGQLPALRAWLGALGAEHELSLCDDTERRRIRALGAAVCLGCGAAPLLLLLARWTAGIEEDQLACPRCGAMFDLDVVALQDQDQGPDRASTP